MAGQRILDIACGTGFGGPILLEAGATAVTGVDMSHEALAEARTVAPGRYAVFRADGAKLPIPDGRVSVVTSFETVEHLHEPEQFVSELRRVLQPSGVMLLSTPNANYTKPVNGVPANPFHVQEFTPAELKALLQPHFAVVDLLGQRTHPRYEICPYWDLPETLPTDIRGRLRVLSWKLQSRLPAVMREGVSRLAHGRAFYPGEHDFVFTEEATEIGHVLMAVCRP